MTKEKRLGRGLEALLGQLPGWNGEPGATPAAGTAPGVAGVSNSTTTVPIIAAVPAMEPVHGQNPNSGAAVTAIAEPPRPQRIAIDQIVRNPHQPRKEFDADDLKQLAESLASHGLLQPVVVRAWQGKFQLIAGERRLRAARQAGWSDVPVTIVEADDRQIAELAIVENMQRKDLNALEKAASFQRYLDQYRCTQEELASRLKLDRSTVANMIRLLELPEAVQDALRRGKITQGHARALLPLGEEREQVEFCEQIQRDALSVRQTESMVQAAISAADNGPSAIAGSVGTAGKNAKPMSHAASHLSSLEQEFRAALGVKVRISHGARGKGKIVIAFSDHEEFEQLREYICGVAEPQRHSKVG